LAKILLVDDEAAMRRMLSVILRSDGHRVAEAEGVEAARKQLRAEVFDLVITDQKMPDGEGLALLPICREIDPTLPVVVLTAFATVELAVEAMRAGAFDFIAKPFHADSVRVVVKRACEHAELLRENERLQGQVSRLAETGDLLGASSAIQTMRETIERVAPTRATVLIIGETGTGKELVARAIHTASRRAREAFVAVNCAAFSEGLLESALFGHERGAFTSADRARPGLFEAADRGTLFLDEASEMSLALQARLLRVLMDGEVVRVGSTVARHVDVRIVAATNRDLEARMRVGLFREDLYYRLAVVPIRVPPLRERLEDVPLLVAHFLRRAAQDLKITPRSISPGAVARLARYAYPGNIRELRNLIERASILARGEAIEPADLPELRPVEAGEADLEAARLAEPEEIALRPAVEDFERRLILRALEQSGGSQAEAGRRLGLSRSAIGYRMKKLGIASSEHVRPTAEDSGVSIP
jgi:DNA-binding NtrC family response regulator